ncbi:hypothetical protein BHM03_00042586 [Ensete ventricosum]|nr:hypothetical protein BHM03_00042586 [Ensete ventricosum]
MKLKPCGVAYWSITFSQVPLSVAFTLYVLYDKKKKKKKKKKKSCRPQDHQQEDGEVSGLAGSSLGIDSSMDHLTRSQPGVTQDKDKAGIGMEALPMFVFPSAALLAGALSGLFGIGGGLLLNPVLLQIGIAPQVRLFRGLSKPVTYILRYARSSFVEVYTLNYLLTFLCFIVTRRVLDCPLTHTSWLFLVDCSSNELFHGDVLGLDDRPSVYNPGHDGNQSSFGLRSVVLRSFSYWIGGHEKNHSEFFDNRKV